MARETLELGSAPGFEDCAQVGAFDYAERAREECSVYRGQLLRIAATKYAAVPPGARLITKANRHDFGTYYQVAVAYDDEDEAAAAFAIFLENNTPERWDRDARLELGLPEEVG